MIFKARHEIALDGDFKILVISALQGSARTHLSPIEGNRGKTPEHKGKLESLVGNKECLALLENGGLVQEQLEEEGEGENDPIPAVKDFLMDLSSTGYNTYLTT